MSALCSLQLRRLEAENHRLESELLASRRSAATGRHRLRCGLLVGPVRTVTSCRCGAQSTACSTRCAAASTHGPPAAFALGTVRHLLLANGGGAFRQARACYAALALDVSHLQVRLLEVEEVRCHSCTA
jgi:hypothetical protein